MTRTILTEDGQYVRSFPDSGSILFWLYSEHFTPVQSGKLLDGYVVNGLKLKVELEDEPSLKQELIKLSTVRQVFDKVFG